MDWERDSSGDLIIKWREHGGPPVKRPTRKGFGSTIIDRSVPYDLGGEASIAFPETGVEATFRIPARHVSEAKGDRTTVIKYPRPALGHPVEPPQRLLADHRLLLVEDSLIIALDAEDIAERLGASKVATAATLAAGLEAVDAFEPTVVMLDINLGDRTSFPIADRLAELGVPFLFASGYGEQAHLPENHRHRPVIQKPYTLENVARAMDVLLAGRT